MRRLLVLALVAAGAGCGGDELEVTPPVEQAGRWYSSAPAAQGIDGAALERAAAFAQREVPTITSFLVARHGRLVLERYYPASVGHDAADDPVDTQSVDKTFHSALVGVALQQEKLEDLDQTLAQFIPEYVRAKPAVADITLRDLLTMRAGFELDPLAAAGGYAGFFASDDWTREVVARPLASAPGTRFLYDDGVRHLLSVVLTRASGMPAGQFATAELFGPLRFHQAFWDEDPKGNGGDTILATPRDMAKLGQLYLRGGRWEGKRLIPAEYVRESTRAQVVATFAPPGVPAREFGYGYLWWMLAPDVYAALGFGGQWIVVYPKLDVVTVTTGEVVPLPGRAFSAFFQLFTELVPAAIRQPSSASDSEPAAAERSVEERRAVPATLDLDLVGRWRGMVDGSFGPGAVVIKLNDTAAMTAEGSGLYCPLRGRWGVSGGDFFARGRDCDGTRVTFEASISGGSISGTWSASSGNSGTFAVEADR